MPATILGPTIDKAEIGEGVMTEEELNAIVEAKLAERLAARLAADRARVRDEVILALRRDACAPRPN
jgi:hypothetical protein